MIFIVIKEKVMNLIQFSGPFAWNLIDVLQEQLILSRKSIIPAPFFQNFLPLCAFWISFFTLIDVRLRYSSQNYSQRKGRSSLSLDQLLCHQLPYVSNQRRSMCRMCGYFGKIYPLFSDYTFTRCKLHTRLHFHLLTLYRRLSFVFAPIFATFFSLTPTYVFSLHTAGPTIYRLHTTFSKLLNVFKRLYWKSYRVFAKGLTLVR